MEKHEFTSTIAALVAVPVVLLTLQPALKLEMQTPDTTGIEEQVYIDNGQENCYMINYKDGIVTAHLDCKTDNSFKINQKVTNTQMLRIKNVVKTYDGDGDPILPILEGSNYELRSRMRLGKAD